MICYGITHKGLVRDKNEDAFFIPQNGECFAAVCDGMGGQNAGEIASSMAIAELCRELGDAAPSQDMLVRAIREVNRAVYYHSIDNEECNGMGTTLTALWWSDDRIIMGHVGDSRAYRMADGELKQISSDHTYVHQLVETGQITPREARKHPNRNVITRAIGSRPDVKVDIEIMPRIKGHRYLLCSDGLTNMVSDKKIKRILNHGTPERQINDLVAEANKHGGIDNITAVLVIDEGDER